MYNIDNLTFIAYSNIYRVSRGTCQGKANKKIKVREKSFIDMFKIIFSLSTRSPVKKRNYFGINEDKNIDSLE